MYYLETDVTGVLTRIEYNGLSNFNLQTPIGGEWVDYHCFTCYEYDNDWTTLDDAMQYALEVLIEESDE